MRMGRLLGSLLFLWKGGISTSKQDYTGVRSAQELERKYLLQISTLKKNVETSLRELVKVENELNDFIISTAGNLTKLQNQIDGNITTWFYNGEPDLDRYPSSNWEDYESHLGDLYYDNSTGYCYRFAKQEDIFKWIKITDSDVTEALSLASMAQDTADGKRRVFTETPKLPYDKGDLYLKNEDLYVCNVSKESGTFEESDFIIATKYTDDTKANQALSDLNTFVNVTYAEGIENLTNQIDGKISTWYYSGAPTLSTEPAINWDTDDLKLTHTGDLYYDKSTGYTYIFQYLDNSYVWTRVTDSDIAESLAIANAAQDTADSKRRIFVIQPEPPYDNGDLWIKDNEIYICQISKAEGQPYQEQDFINSLKYTDDTLASAIVDELGGTETTVLQGQVVVITKNFAKFTDLADPNSSTEIAGENITTGNIKSKNYVQNVSGMKISLVDGTIDTKNFKVLDDGNIGLYNGAVIISEKGMMTNLMFRNNFNDLQQVGYTTEPDMSINQYSFIELPIYIPKDFTITDARLVLEHIPIRFNNNGAYIWGNCRNVKVYKDVEASTFYKDYELYPSGYDVADIYTDEISGAFGSDGFTSQTPSDSSHTKEIAISSNIASSLSTGSTRLQIRSGNAVPAYNPDIGEAGWYDYQTNCLQQTGYLRAVLYVSGFLPYESEV